MFKNIGARTRDVQNSSLSLCLNHACCLRSCLTKHIMWNTQKI